MIQNTPSPKGIQDQYLAKFLKALWQTLQVRLFGAEGKLETVVTFQDLVDLGVLTENDIEDGRVMVKYFGDAFTDGSWKIERTGEEFGIYKREHGEWIKKGLWS